MDDRDSIALFGGEVIALVPLLRGHFTTLSSLWENPTSAEYQRAEAECRRLLQALTDLSAAYHVTDCALVGAELLHLVADVERRMRVAMSIPAIAGSLDYLVARAKAFTHFRRVLDPTEAENEARQRLLRALSSGEASSVSIAAAPAVTATDGGAVDAPDVAEEPTPEAPDYAASNAGVVSGDVSYYETFEPPRREAPAEAIADELSAEDVEQSTLDASDLDAIRAFQSSRLMPPQTTFADYVQPVVAPIPDESLAELDEVPPELRDFFRREAADDLHQLRLLVVRVEQNPDDTEAIAEMRRAAHKLKGSAAQFGFDALAETALTLEDMVRVLEGRQVLPSEAVLRDMDDLLDVMEGERVATSGEHAVEAPPSQPLAPTWSSRTLPPTTTGTLGAVTTETGALRVPQQANDERILRLALREVDELTAHVQALVFARAGLAATQADAQNVQGDLQRIADRLRRVSAELGDIEPADEALSSGRWQHQAPGASSSGPKVPGFIVGSGPDSSMAARSEPSAWEVARRRELSQTAQALHEIAADLAAESASLRTTLQRLAEASEGQRGASDDLQRTVMKMRLVPVGDLQEYLDFEIHRAQRNAGKLVDLRMRGKEIQIDRDVCEALREPLTQLLRNAVIHGIESPEERLSVGKLERGEVWINASCSGSDLILEVGDNGRGISQEGLVAAAVAAGVIDPHTPDELSTSRTLDLMFEPAVTTTSEARLLGGRGIGLDEVRTAIGRLGGTVSVTTEEGKGSAFRIQTPISLTTMRALHVTAGGAMYAVPFGVVERTVLLTEAPSASNVASTDQRRIARVPLAHGELGGAEGSERDGEDLPIFTLDELLGFEAGSPHARYALVVDSAQGRAAILVDGVVDEREVLVQTLPRHLQRRALRGTTITQRGELTLIVDVVALVEWALGASMGAAQKTRRPTLPPQAAPLQRVLVVDDSEAVRRAVELILHRGGYSVEMAGDGVEALAAIEAQAPDVVLLDVEMPRMGGLELLAALEGRFPEQMHVIMLTSRGSQEHMEKAIQLGATTYLVKPCPQDVLLEAVRSALARTTVRV